MKVVKFLVVSLLFFCVEIPSVKANLIGNGGFEIPAIWNSSIVAYQGDTWLSSWEITSGSVDLVGGPSSYWQAYEGNNSLDLSGFYDNGIIKQTFATIPNQSYNLTFAYANNYYRQSASASVQVKGLSILLNSPISHSSSMGADNMNFTLFNGSFIADSSTTSIIFTSSTEYPGFGIVLDDVSVLKASTSVPEPSFALLLGLGLGAVSLAGWRFKA
jgi:choice-of-anchor C domain-containing protein